MEGPLDASFRRKLVEAGIDTAAQPRQIGGAERRRDLADDGQPVDSNDFTTTRLT